jgi:hypothetical protein
MRIYLSHDMRLSAASLQRCGELFCHKLAVDIGKVKWAPRVQFKVRVIPDLVDTLGIQNFEKTATNFTKGFIFTRAWASALRWPMRGDRRFRGIRGIRGVLNSLTRTSDFTRAPPELCYDEIAHGVHGIDDTTPECYCCGIVWNDCWLTGR